MAPIRILLSFGDFLTVRARSSPASSSFVNEKEHSQRLAVMCLMVMNIGLKRDIGDLTLRIYEIEGIARTVGKCITEELQYAGRFWTDHVACRSYSSIR